MSGTVQDRIKMQTDLNSLWQGLYTVKNWAIWVIKKCALLKKTRNSLNANIFVPFGFKNKTRKWNSNFTITSLFCIFLQHLLKKVVKGKNGLKPEFIFLQTRQFRALYFFPKSSPSWKWYFPSFHDVSIFSSLHALSDLIFKNLHKFFKFPSVTDLRCVSRVRLFFHTRSRIQQKKGGYKFPKIKNYLIFDQV